MNRVPPLAVDLDGTLVNTDLFFESAVWYIRKNPLRFFQMCWWFITMGRAELKLQIENRVALPVSDLPFNQNIIKWLRDEKEKGRELVLVTGASQKYAEQVAEYMGLFSDVFGVCKERPRLTGHNKRRFLVKRYGEKNFDYVGNSTIDLAVWKKARRCIVANAFPFVIHIAQKIFSEVQVISEPFSLSQYWNLFEKFFSVLFLRVCIFMIPFIFVLMRIEEQGNSFLHAVLILPGIVLLYITAFLLGELQDLGPHRKAQQKGIFYCINPYWGLLGIPLMIYAFFYISKRHELIPISVWWFLIYFVLEYMRWIFRKYYIYYDTALTCFLWMLGFAVFIDFL